MEKLAIILKRKIYKFFSTVLKNLISFFVGATFGILTVIMFAEPLLKFAINKDVGLGIIALAPAMLIMYSLIFGIIGGVLGIIGYNLFKVYKRK